MRWLVVIGAWMACISCLADMDSFREIYPIPRHADYGETIIPLEGFVLKASDGLDRQKLSMYAGEFSVFLERFWGRTFFIDMEDDHLFPVVIVHAGDGDGIPGSLEMEEGLRLLPEGSRGGQGYVLKVTPEGATLAVKGFQGAVFGLASLIQLLRPAEDGSWTLRDVQAVDWPAFEMRMGSPSWIFRNAPLPTQEESLFWGSTMVRFNFGEFGYPGHSDCHQYALEHGLRLCSGYWTRPKGEPPLNPWNWSDPKVNQEYVDIALQIASWPGLGAYFWHDVTDAGWWHVYIQDFWNKRDDLDRKNYPDDTSPVRPDALRFKAMFEALDRDYPDLAVVWTPPVYYDLPGKDDLPDVAHFRDYLDAISRSVPSSMRDRFYVMLEERPPDVCEDYSRYMNGLKIVQYRYNSIPDGNSWELSFTEAKEHDGRTAGYFFGGPVLLDSIAAQYLWNPQLPTDEEFIVRHLAPRAAWLLFGHAGEAVLAFVKSNFNAKTIVRENNLGVLQRRQADVRKSMAALEDAREKLPPGSLFAAHVLEGHIQQARQYLEAVEATMEQATRIVPLEDAVIAFDGGAAEGLKEAAMSDGKLLWHSGFSPAPHAIDVMLPTVYDLNRILVRIGSGAGYSWRDAELQADIGGFMKTVCPMNGYEDVIGTFDNVRTDHLRIVFRMGWDWSKVVRNDVFISGIALYGKEAPKDPPGTMRLDGRWFFRTDPAKEGVKAEWFNGNAVEEWARITVPSLFEESGIPGTVGYDGTVWYAVKFDTPAGWRGKAVKLLFGAVDDEAEAWLNGIRLGIHAKQGDADTTWWEEPFRFDVTEALVPEGEPNILVVRVEDYAVGGGIWKSVFLHIGDGPGLYSGQ